MNNNYNNDAVGYRFTDGAALIHYAQDSAASFMEIERDNDNDNYGGVGEWRGAIQVISLIPINMNIEDEKYDKQYSALLYAASRLDDITPENSLFVYINLIR